METKQRAREEFFDPVIASTRYKRRSFSHKRTKGEQARVVWPRRLAHFGQMRFLGVDVPMSVLE